MHKRWLKWNCTTNGVKTKLWNLSNSNVSIFNHFHLIDSLTKVFLSKCGYMRDFFGIGVVFRIYISNYDSLTNMETFLAQNELHTNRVMKNEASIWSRSDTKQNFMLAFRNSHYLKFLNPALVKATSSTDFEILYKVLNLTWQ